MSNPRLSALAARLPFYYGWVVIAVAFVTLAIGVNGRTAFSLLFPPLLEEFGWERGVTAGAFSLGFLATVILAPLSGVLVDRFGPATAMCVGATMVSLGFVLVTYAESVTTFYLTLGLLCIGGSIFMAYLGHSTFLPNWFVRRRGLAIGIAFSGVGIGAMVLFPLVQLTIDSAGWRGACRMLALLTFALVVPLNVLLQRKHPRDVGLEPDGASSASAGDGASARGKPHDYVVDPTWANRDWTLATAVRTGRYWWCFVGYFCALYAWYAVQVHQVKFVVDVGLSSELAAFALGLVGLTGIVGQIGLGHLSDRLGRELSWSLACLGYVICYAALLALPYWPSAALVYLMASAQGLLGYGISTLFSTITAELFQGRRYGTIFGSLAASCGLGAAAGAWTTGWMHDAFGNYELAFIVALLAAVLAAIAIWMAAPGKVRAVAGVIERRARSSSAPEAGNASAALEHPRAGPAVPTGAADPAVVALAIERTPIRVATGASVRLRGHALDGQGRRVAPPSRFRWRLIGCTGEVTPSADGRDAILTVAAESGTGGRGLVELGLEPCLEAGPALVIRREVTVLDRSG